MNPTKTTKATLGTTLAFASLVKLWPWLRPNKGLVLIGSSMIPVVAIIAMFQPLTIQRAIDEGILKGDLRQTIFWACACLGLSFISYIFSGIQALTTATAVHRMIRDLRTTLMSHVLRLAPAWHDHQISGALATRATSDFDTLSESLNQGVLSSVIDILVLIGCIAGMFILSAKLALTALVILPVMTWLVIWFSKRLNGTMLASRKNLAALNGFTQEAMTSLSAVKLLNAEKGVTTRYNTLNKLYRDTQLENVYYDSLMFSSIDGISSITLGVVLFIAIKATGHGTDLTAGILVAFVQYVQQLFEPLKQLGTKMAMLQGAFTSMERIFGLLDRNDKVSGSAPVSWPNSVTIDFKNVSFAYKPHGTDALSNVSFSLPAGKSLAIIASTGSGKSTIAKLITKLYDGYRGSVEIAGQPILDFDPENVRSNMGIVPQDIVLFEGSIAFNISFGRPGVSREQIESAAKIIGAETFINQLPGQYEFQVREQGTNLSHGQRQLIVFARALVSNPPLLILDEATSSIDPQSEALIQTATEKLLAGRTVIVIAHRLATIKRCDLVLVLEHGKVSQFGTPAQLLQSGGRYSQLLSLSEKAQS
jgi:ABC-type multidrug transport system fused ATPase/permease subunit